jgi:hypothetical protein
LVFKTLNYTNTALVLLQVLYRYFTVALSGVYNDKFRVNWIL